nr:MAG TPA: hypothetical protein [Caudoviricetes sp.]
MRKISDDLFKQWSFDNNFLYFGCILNDNGCDYDEISLKLEGMGYKKDHSATECGYLKNKYANTLEPYSGRFGVGYKLHRKSTSMSEGGKSNMWHIIEYWV